MKLPPFGNHIWRAEAEGRPPRAEGVGEYSAVRVVEALLAYGLAKMNQLSKPS